MSYYRKKLSDDLFEPVKVYLPRGTVKLLKEMSEHRAIPVSRLIAMAVDNELDCEPKFNYPSTLPTTPYKEYMYAKEAGALLNFLKKAPKGMGRDTILLARRDLGIIRRETVLEALRELLEKGLVEEFKPKHIAGRHPKGYTRVRVVGDVYDSKTKYKRIEGVSTKGVNPVKDEEVSDE